MKIRTDLEQNSLDWLVARAGVVTASEFDNLLTPKFEPRKGQTPETYLWRKLAERWTGGPLPGYQTLDMEAGQIRESEAIPAYEFEHSEQIQRVGFVTTDDERVGCSPDGLIGDDGGIEVKCPMAHTHVGYLLGGEVPEQHLTQVHGSIYVTGRKWWRFMSYRRGFPMLVKLVERDDAIQRKIDATLKSFLSRFDSEWKRLCDMNGGPPAKREPFTHSEQPESCDIIP